MKKTRWEKLGAQLRPIFQKHKVIKAIVFGSLARGEETRRSDIDLIVIQNTEKRFLDRYDDILSEIIRAIPGFEVDLLIYTPQELRQLADRPLRAFALKEGKIIYESGQKSPSSRAMVKDSTSE